MRFLIFLLTLLASLNSCVSDVSNPVAPNIELEGATTEEIEDGSFAEVSIDYSSTSAYRDELYFLALGNQVSEGAGYYVTLNIDPKGRVIKNPRLSLPVNFEFIGTNPNLFSTLYGTCDNIISSPCQVIVLFTPGSNFLSEDEILFNYVYQDKGYLTRTPFSFKAVGKINPNLTYGPISNGVGNNMCAIGMGGEIKCWGSPADQNLGISDKYANWGDSSDEMSELIPVYQTTNSIRKIQMHKQFGCVHFNNNQLKCFGKNNDGALGKNNSLPISIIKLNQAEPLKFPSELTLLDFSIGDGHVCGLFSTAGQNEVRCWGRNDLGQSGSMDSIPLGYGYSVFNSSLGFVTFDFVEDSIRVQHQYFESNIAKVVAGKHSNCMLFENGLVKCWGDNLYGQLGLGDRQTRGIGNVSTELFNPAGADTRAKHLLIDLGTGKVAQDLYAGASSEHFCAKLSDTELKCWGRNDNGQLGQDSRNHKGDDPGEMGDALGAYTPPAGFKIVNAVLGTSHTCVHVHNDSLTGASAHKLFCFGIAQSIGSGDIFNLGDDGGEMAALQEVDLGNDFEIKAVYNASTSTCVHSANHKVKCFGLNEYGQLGTGNTQTIGDGIFEMGDSLNTLRLPILTKINSVVTSEMNTCLVFDDKKVSCIGSNSNGFINSSQGIDLATDPANAGAALAALPLGSEKAIQVSVGKNHACAVFANRKVKCWGRNDFGQLGYGHNRSLIDLSKETEEVPYVDLGSFIFAESIHAGDQHTCAVVYQAYVYDGSEPPPNRIKCWGRNQYGQLGRENTATIGDQPDEMGDDLDFVDLGEDGTGNPFTVVDFDSGSNHNCVVVNTDPASFASARKIKCWGKNDDGQLGQESSFDMGDNVGEMGNGLPFTNISSGLTPFTDFSEVKLGHDFGCARRGTSIYCWGKNDKGQLGIGNTNSIGDNGGEMDGDIDPIFLSGGSVPNFSNFNFSTGIPIPNGKSQWTVGANHVCVISNDFFQNIFCWGDGKNLGAGYGNNVGNVSSILGTKFNQNRDGARILGISSQAESTCVHYADGMAKCWGEGRYLGNGRSHDMGNYYRSLISSGGSPIFPFLWF